MVTVLSQVDFMVGILVDSCGWVAISKSGINIDIEMEKIVGKAELKITRNVKNELSALDNKNLMLQILFLKAEVVGKQSKEHTDAELINLSRRFSWPVLTIDKKLKAKLVKNGCSYIEVTSSKSLRMIEA